MSEQQPYVGIDPGVTGALAAYWPDTGHIEIEDMPRGVDGRGRKIVNPVEVAAIISDWNPRHVAMEFTAPRPKQGVAGMYRFGEAVGVVKGVVGALRIPLFTVTPQGWKKRAGLLRKDKQYARTVVVNQHPEYASYFSRKLDVDRAEAVLIAKHVAEWEASHGNY